MDIMIVLLFTFTFIYKFKCYEAYGLVINSVQIPFAIQPNNRLYPKADTTLNMTCKVTSDENKPFANFNLTWLLPFNQQNSKHRITIMYQWNEISLLVHNLQERDSGNYTCEAYEEKDAIRLTEYVQVNVKSKKASCYHDKMFLCPTGTCINRRYMCDGHRDCKNGEDEAEVYCGREPCSGKLHCGDGRCIPFEWCCDEYQDPNCSVTIRHTCCQKLVMEHEPGIYDEQRINDMGFLQTTIYTVIGCATAFMFIVSILVIAICRVHMKRSLMSRCPNGSRVSGFGAPIRGGSHPHHLPLYDLDVFLNRSTFLQPSNSDISLPGSLRVTYNINNGVQFVGRPIDPPPYCEVVASPPREGPPPPYVSHESIVQSIVTTIPKRDDDDDDDDDDDSQIAGEGDSLLGTGIRHDANVGPVICQSGSTLQVTIIHPPAPCTVSPEHSEESNRTARSYPPDVAPSSSVEEYHPLLDASVSTKPSYKPTELAGTVPDAPGHLRESFIGLRGCSTSGNGTPTISGSGLDAKMSHALRLREEFLNCGPPSTTTTTAASSSLCPESATDSNVAGLGRTH